jgi:hypothetical protein
MLKWLRIACVCLIASTCNAQDTLKVYSWEEALNASPDTIYAIEASRRKWERIPEELYMYTNLVFLDLSNNKLTEIPDAFSGLKKLKAIDLEHNKLSGSPVFLCQLTNLINVNIGRNDYSSLPSCIGYLANLKSLNLWSNPLGGLPDEIMLCKNLKMVDMRGIVTGPVFQSKWVERMPEVNWEFDPPCHCVE